MKKLLLTVALPLAFALPIVAHADDETTCDNTTSYEAPQNTDICDDPNNGHTGFGAAACIRVETQTCTDSHGHTHTNHNRYTTNHCIQVGTPTDDVQTQCAGN